MNETGLYWKPLGGNNIDQISGHSYQYTNITKNNDSDLLNTTIIVDLGKFDNHSALGVYGSGAAVPDIRSLISSVDNNAIALLITHAHPDHLNGIVHYLKAGYTLPDIYGGLYTKIILDDLYSEFEIAKKNQPKYIIIKDEQELSIGTINITVLASSHTCFDSFGFVIKSEYGCVYHTGDMKIDNSIYFRKATNLKLIKKLSPMIDCVVADFCCVDCDGYATKEVETFKKMSSLIKSNAKKKIFIPVYPTHPEMYIIAFLAALKNKRNIVFYGSKDFYTYLTITCEHMVNFADIIKDRIKMIYHPDDGLEDLGDDYAVIGTYNSLANYFDEDEENSFGIITAKTFFNPLKGQLNSHDIKFVTVDTVPELQGYGHGFFGDYEYLNNLLDSPTFIPTHCPAFIVDNIRQLATYINMKLAEITPYNNFTYKIEKKSCRLISSEPAKWLVVKYDDNKASFVEVAQKPTSGEGLLKRTISNKRSKRKFDMILNHKKKIVNSEVIC